MIELDEDWPDGMPEPGNADSDVNTLTPPWNQSEYARCTCLDRACIALNQSGQIHCAGVMRQLQEMFDSLAYEYEMDPNDPCGILRGICGV